jgi:NAD(P)-dependent dehydrogenase (short-subunit alcohol dehydrogenase family)
MTTILITGANRGIGLEFTRQYAAEGAQVIACCRNPPKATTLAAIAGVSVMELDVGDAASAGRLAKALNGVAIDILINCAGVFGHATPGTEESYYDEFTKTFRTNSIGPLIVSQALRNNLVRGHDKKLVALTSLLGSIAEHGGNWLSYRASKAALNSIMRGLSRDWAGDGILVGIFHPGWVKTDMGGADAPVTPEESVRGLRARIAELSPQTSGHYTDYRGKEIAW